VPRIKRKVLGSKYNCIPYAIEGIGTCKRNKEGLDKFKKMGEDFHGKRWHRILSQGSK
jgi:hypothetical protein